MIDTTLTKGSVVHCTNQGDKMKSLKTILVLVVVQCSHLTPAQAQPLIVNGLEAYYSFSGNANDTSGNGHNGVMTGGSFVTDRYGVPEAP